VGGQGFGENPVLLPLVPLLAQYRTRNCTVGGWPTDPWNLPPPMCFRCSLLRLFPRNQCSLLTYYSSSLVRPVPPLSQRAEPVGVPRLSGSWTELERSSSVLSCHSHRRLGKKKTQIQIACWNSACYKTKPLILHEAYLHHSRLTYASV
jgi:hypothetical protein